MRRTVFRFFLTLFLSLGAAPIFAGPGSVPLLKQLQHSAWRQDDGAPSSVAGITEDREGFLWLAAKSGLYRFDGARFERFSALGGVRLPANSVQSVRAFSDGRLFIGYQMGGVSVFKDGVLKTYGAADGLPTGTVQFLRQAPDGTIWGAFGQGIARFNGNKWERVERKDKSRFGLLLEIDDRGTVFTNDGKGVWFRRTGDDDFAFLPGSDGELAMVFRGKSGRLWLMTSDKRKLREVIFQDGSYQFAGAELALPASAYPDRLVVDEDGAGWVLSDEGATRILDRSGAGDLTKGSFESFTQAQGMSGGTSTYMFEDSKRNMWVATTGGLDRFRRGAVQMQFPVANMQFPAVTRASDGKVWIGTSNEGFARVSRNSTELVTGLKAAITAIGSAANGGVWVGASDRLWRLTDGHPTEVPPPDGVGPKRGGANHDRYQAILEDAKGVLWVSITRAGVFRRVDNEWRQASEFEGVPKGTAIAMASEPDGSVWLTYMSGRARRVNPDGTVLQVEEQDGLSVGNVLSVYTSKSGTWFGGERGLVLRSPDGRFASLRLEAVQPELSGVTGIALSPTGDLWLAEVNGVIKIASAEWKRAVADNAYRMRARRYDFRDGMDGSIPQLQKTPTLVVSDDGAVWFITQAGVGRIEPDEQAPPDAAPSPVVQRVRADGHELSMGGALEASAGVAMLQLEYTAPHLSDASRLRFAYRLVGYDKEWHEVGARREAVYTHLPPGQYEFQVVTTTIEGVRSGHPHAVKVTVLPFFWQAGWFYAVSAAALLVLMYGLYRLRMRSVAASVRATLEARTIERERIARDLHDTVLQGVTALTLQVRAAVEQLPVENPTKARLEVALQGARSVMREGRERLEGLREAPNLERLASVALSEAVAEVCVELGRQHVDTSYQVSVEGHETGMELDKAVEVYSIAREALTNAFRHAHATRIDALLLYTGSTLRLSVTDNGIGLQAERASEASRTGHFGVVGMRERARALGGSLEVLDANPGATIQLTIPMSAQASRSHQFAQRRRRIETTTILRAERHASTE